MPRPLAITIPHSLGKDEARRRLENGFERLQQQITGGLGGKMLGLHNRWDADRLYFEGSMLGQKVTGRCDVKPESVQMEIDLPEILAAIAEVIRQKLGDEGRKLLERK